MVHYPSSVLQNRLFMKTWFRCKFSTFTLKQYCNKPHSSLLISGKRADNTFVVVIPHLDFDKRFENISEMEMNIKRRKLNVNATEMKECWNFYKHWNDKKVTLQENFDNAKKQTKDIMKKEESEQKKKELENVERYKKILKEELHEVKKNVWSLEDTVVCELLNLPNTIHYKAPEIEEELFVFDQENVESGNSHLEMGVKLNCLDFRNNLEYFTKNDAAIFELAVTELFVCKFNERGFLRFSNPDFTRSVLSEGVGVSPEDCSELYLLENSESNNDRLHLCGGASLFPFCGFHAKHAVPKHLLPSKYIAAGRHYSPVTSSLPGLYSVHQTTSVQTFVATFGDEELDHEFQSCVKICTDIFCDLGLRFKVVNQPPHCFKTWESLRVSFQVFSPHEEVFVEVGYLSLIDDFISKRLRMCYDDKKGELFLKVLTGKVVNTQTLLALCLERSQTKLFIPDIVKDFMI